MKILALFLFILTSCAHQSFDPNKETVVLIHGFGRSPGAMWKMASRLEEAGYNVERIGYESLNKNIENIQEEVFKQIDECCSQLDKKVHFVGHSLGGLLARAYLGKKEVKNLGNVVMIGSPNKGTELIDHYQDRWYFSMLGPSAMALSSKGSDFLSSLKPPYYSLGIIAGSIDKDNEERLPGPDDGLVSVDSTKVEGMKDFIIVNVSHSKMRSSEEVFKQTLSFLRKASFEK